MTYFTSDLHLGHANIIASCGRPFSSVEEMDETLIANWNRKVHNDDTVYIIGDLIWEKGSAAKYLPRLKGKKVLIYGNHDEAMIGDAEYRSYFEEIVPMKFIPLCGHQMTMCHYPMLEWKASRKEGSPKLGWLIYGHIHNRIDAKYRPMYETQNALNAGVDVNGCAPVTFDEMAENNEVFRKRAMTVCGK